MAESQSRYSIVERLTKKKLELMSSKSSLKQDVKSKEQKIGKLKKRFRKLEKGYSGGYKARAKEKGT